MTQNKLKTHSVCGEAHVLEDEQANCQGRKIRLMPGQIQSVAKLIDQEMEKNRANGDEAYNTYWGHIKSSLGYSFKEHKDEDR